MQYAQLNSDGTYSHQITSFDNIPWDADNFCSAAALVRDGKAEQFHVVELHETDAPDIDPMTETVMRDGGEFVNGRWQYGWRVDPLSEYQAAQAVSDYAAAARRGEVSAIREEYAAAVAQLEAMYYVKERETWPQQVAEAKAYQDNPDAATPFLDALLTSRPGVLKAQLVGRILGNSALYSAAVGAALGAMQEQVAALGATS